MHNEVTAAIAFALLGSLKALLSLLSFGDVEDKKEEVKKHIKEIEKHVDKLPDDLKEKVTKVSDLLGDEDKENDPEKKEIQDLLVSIKDIEADSDVALSPEIKGLYKKIAETEKFDLNDRQNVDLLISSIFNIDPKDVENISKLNITPIGLIGKAMARSEQGKAVFDKISESVTSEDKVKFANQFIQNAGGMESFLTYLIQSELGDENKTSLDILGRNIELSEDSSDKARGELLKAAAKTLISFGGSLLGFE